MVEGKDAVFAHEHGRRLPVRVGNVAGKNLLKWQGPSASMV
jgi:hypothetical protein